MNREIQHLIQYLETQKGELRRLSKAAFQDPEPSLIHRLRIVVRKIRAANWILSRGSPPIYLKALDRDLKRIGRALGAVRELDVAIQDAESYRIDAAKLRSHRKLKRKSVLVLLKSKRRKERSKKLERAIKSLKTCVDLKMHGTWLELIGSVISMAENGIRGAEELHRFRKMVKKLRYSLEAAGYPVEQLKHLLKYLGRTHDLDMLQSLLGRDSTINRERSYFCAKALSLTEPALQKTLRVLARDL